jgi:hypothetical protein
LISRSAAESIAIQRIAIDDQARGATPAAWDRIETRDGVVTTPGPFPAITRPLAPACARAPEAAQLLLCAYRPVWRTTLVAHTDTGSARFGLVVVDAIDGRVLEVTEAIAPCVCIAGISPG